jgi:hypothetical protein
MRQEDQGGQQKAESAKLEAQTIDQMLLILTPDSRLLTPSQSLATAVGGAVEWNEIRAVVNVHDPQRRLLR